MKQLLIVGSFFIILSCGKTTEHKDHDHDGMDNGEDPNQALYEQVMDIHDEVMPKMEDIFKLKKELQDKIANTPGMVADQKKELENMILTLDSSNNAMMDWMHNFSPLPDSANQEAAREYLENEMERIKQVRDRTNETLEKARSMTEKK
jgi:peptidoglycan hydrolase CwlO-like protein